jgi:hypothetical protein
MSHGKERTEKNCLNCNARVFGRYCHVCGQENIEPKETAWELVAHFVNDITHFEGKFITSLRYLFFKPGFLTAEYLRGRRASYMNPVRMYVFTSAFFFIIFFTFFKNENDESTMFKIKEDGNEIKVPDKPISIKAEALKNAKNKKDSEVIEQVLPNDSTLNILKKNPEKKSAIRSIPINGRTYNSVAEYDSVQKNLAPDKKDKWYQRLIERRLLIVDEKFGGDLSKFNKALFEYVLHSLPKVLFLSLPLFALALALLYIRRKQFYYVSHLILTIHLFVFVFLMLLLIFTNNKIEQQTGWNLGLFTAFLWVYMFYYLYRAMRVVYQQARFKTLVKYFLLLFMALIMNSILFLALFSYSFFKV